MIVQTSNWGSVAEGGNCAIEFKVHSKVTKSSEIWKPVVPGQ